MNDTLDVSKGKSLSIDDLVFEDTEVITSEPAASLPPVESAKPEETTPGTEPVEVKVIPPTFDELEFEESEADANSEPAVEGQKPVGKKEGRDLTVDAIKALLTQRMERYGIEAEDANIADMTEEELVAFEESLDEAILESRWNNVKTVDKNVEKLVSYIESGGDPKDIVALFKEQESLGKIDISTEDGQAKMVKDYYTKILGWDDEKSNRKLERLAATGTLEEEAQDVEESYNEHFEKKQQELLADQENRKNILIQRERQKKAIFEHSLESFKVPKKLADEYKQTAFGKGIIKGTNEEISILDYKIMQMQTNPEMFLKLVQFATDPKGYDAMIAQGKKNEDVVVGMKKGFQVPTSSKTSENVPVKSQTKQKFKFNL